MAFDTSNAPDALQTRLPNRQKGLSMAIKRMVYRSPDAKAWLTTDSAASSYGKPVLRCIFAVQLKMVDCGPDDVLPNGLTARAMVQKVLPELTGVKKAMAESFLA